MKIYLAHIDHGYSGLSEPKFVTEEKGEIDAYIKAFEDTYQTGYAVFEVNAKTGEIKKI